MRKKQQPKITSLLLNRDASHVGKKHHHLQGQFFIIRHGLLVLETPQGRVVIPPGYGGWIPPLVPHNAKSYGPIEGHSMYLAQDICKKLPLEPIVFIPSKLLHEIFERLFQPVKAWQQMQQNLFNVMLDELSILKPSALYLPMPQDKNLEKLALGLMQDPAQGQTIEEHAKSAHMSKRTFTRHFRAQTGMSFARWRQLVRVMKALEYLAKGKSVTWIALSLGYDSVSAFIKMFQELIGKTPAMVYKKEK